jgi:tetratricopeptide (TPR) repeat protein
MCKLRLSMRNLLVTSLLALSVGAVAVTGVLLPTSAHAEKFSKAVGEPLQAAQAAIKKKQWTQALGSIKQAQAVSGKTPFEEYTINELLGYVLLQTGDSAGAIKAFEANLAQTPADQLPGRIKTLAQLNASPKVKNYPKAIEYGNRWIKNSPSDTDAYYLVAQSYYQTQDCKNSLRVLQNGMDVSRKNGQPVKENWLDMKLFCQDKLDDKEGLAETREQLVRNNPSRENWDNLLTTLYTNPNNDDLTTLGYFRLGSDLDVLKKPDHYFELAQMSIESKVPGEAVAVLEKGINNKVFTEKRDQERSTRLLNNAKAQADAIKAELPKLEQEAAAAKTGEADVTLGMAYISAGQYDKAVEALRRGLQKGAGKRTDEANIMLGRAYLKLKQKDAARKAFKAVPDDSKLARVAELYDLHAAQS